MRFGSGNDARRHLRSNRGVSLDGACQTWFEDVMVGLLMTLETSPNFACKVDTETSTFCFVFGCSCHVSTRLHIFTPPECKNMHIFTPKCKDTRQFEHHKCRIRTFTTLETHLFDSLRAQTSCLPECSLRNHSGHQLALRIAKGFYCIKRAGTHIHITLQGLPSKMTTLGSEADRP